MNFKKHLIIFIVAFAGWLGFYLMGMPFNYFIDWSIGEKILIAWMGFFAILPLFCFFLVVFLGGDYFKTSRWVALYAALLPFILDTVIVGLIQGKGMGFLVSHWYLTIGYFEALIVMPLTGLALKKLKENIKGDVI